MPQHPEEAMDVVLMLMLSMLCLPCAGDRRGAAGTAAHATGTLSQILKQHPHLYDRQRLAVVEKYIGVVDAVPRRYQDTQVR